MNSLTSPAAYNRTFSAYRRVSESTDDCGITSRDFSVKKNFRARIQSAKGSRPTMEMGVQQVLVTHQIFSPEDLSELKKEDMLRDEVTEVEYVVMDAADVAGSGSLWRIDVWKK